MDTTDQIITILDASINPTPVDATVSHYTPKYSTDQIKQMEYDLGAIAKENERLKLNAGSFQRQLSEIQMKVDAVKGYIADIYSTNGDIDDDIKEIAGYLDIELTKSVTGTATFQISFTAEVPLDFDADDFEISFSAECDSYEAEGFDWNEDDTNIQCEDEF